MKIFSSREGRSRLPAGAAAAFASAAVLWACLGAAALAPKSSSPAQAAASRPDSQEQQQLPGVPPEILRKQQKELLKANFEKLKQDSDDLLSLAKELQEELDKSNEKVLSLKVIQKAEKIEKLAKKIRDEAKGA